MSSIPPYGLSRLLLDEKREPLHVLEADQHKGIQNQRVTLTEGPPEQVEVVRRIFEEFVEKGYSEYKIAEGLNDDGIPSPSNGRWGAGGVLARLRNEKYAGTMVYNRTSGKLKTLSLPNPVEEWIRTTDAFTGIIEFDLYIRAQEIFEKRRQRYDPDYMLRMLDALYRSRGMVRPRLIRRDEELPSPCAYARQFGSLDQAFQKLFDGERDKARSAVHEQILGHIPETLAYSDFLVLDQKLTVSIQPAVPVPHGYESYWPIHRDPRPVNGWSKDTVIEAIRERHRNGESLWQTHRDDRGLYEAAKRHLGTWTAARAAAGFPKPTREFYSPDEVRLAIIDLYERELPLTFGSHRDANLRRSAIKHFGGWRKAVESLGLGGELPRRWTKQLVIEAILELRASGHRLFKTCAEDKSLFRAGIKHFGNWEKALQAAGINETARQRWNEEKVIERLRMLSAKHPGEKVRRHDSNLAYAAEKRFGTLARALQAAGLPTKQTQRRAAS